MMIPPDEGHQIERLARVLRWGPAGVGTLAGRGPTGRLGRAGEFEEYRPWRPGDDLSSLDVRVYRRLRRRVARVDREDSALPLTILVDRSASMDDPERERCVRGLTSFFLALARAQGEPSRLLFFAGNRPHAAAGIEPGTVEGAFEANPCSGTSDFARSFAATPIDPHGPGRVVIFTDGFGLTADRALAPLARLGRGLLLAPLTDEERSPSLRGPVRFLSRESEASWSGVVDAATITRYREGMRARFEFLERWFRTRGGDAHSIAAAKGWAGAVETCLDRGRVLCR